MTSPAPESALAKVREDLGKLPAAQRQSVDALLVEHLAALVDADPTVSAIKELRIALAALTGDQPLSESDPVDEVQRRREARRSRGAAS